MNTKPILDRSRSVNIAVGAVLSAVVAIGILAAVTTLFQSRGVPMEQLDAAERTCASLLYVSARENCMREWLAASRVQSVASAPTSPPPQATATPIPVGISSATAATPVAIAQPDASAKAAVAATSK
jgi:hypothetical protein